MEKRIDIESEDLERMRDIFSEDSPQEKRLERTQEILRESYGVSLSISRIAWVLDAYTEAEN